MQRIIYTPPGGPQGTEIYKVMGEANIFKMMSDFYKELEKSELRHLFPADMEGIVANDSVRNTLTIRNCLRIEPNQGIAEFRTRLDTHHRPVGGEF